MDCSIVGLSGEKGCHQFLPSTWITYSNDVFGYVAEINENNENYIAHKKIYGWLISGYSPRDIFLMWNQGHVGECKAGINKAGTKYDSCEYADKAMALFESVIHNSSVYTLY